MKAICPFAVFLIMTILCQGQKFDLKSTIDLSDTVGFHAIEWMDTDNDGTLDVLAFGKNSQNEDVLFFIQNDTLNGFSFRGHFNTKMANAAYHLTDYNGDNAMDILVSGMRNNEPVTAVCLNKGAFTFESSPLINEAGKVIRYEDFNLDGRRELLLSGGTLAGSFIKIYYDSASEWIVAHDSITIAAHDLEILDFENDQYADFFVSGTDENGNIVNRYFHNEGNFYFTERNYPSPVLGRVSSGDINHDGNIDMLASGRDMNAIHGNLIFRNTPAGFVVRDTLQEVFDATLFAADFNSDGISDLSVTGFHVVTDTVNVILRPTGVDTLDYKDFLKQQFGDFDRDGDLDQLALLKRTNGYGIVLQENLTAEKNLAPGPPLSPVSSTIFNRFFMYWEKPEDDHTPVSALTYDVSIQSTGENLLTAQFDLINGRRLLVSQGNNGAANYLMKRIKQAGDLTYNIQAIDNSFHAGRGGICSGSGRATLCADADIISIDACKNETITLSASEGAMWFSFDDGLVSRLSTYAFKVQHADTIFSFAPNAAGCGIKVYIVNTPPQLAKVSEIRKYVCAGQVLSFAVESGWTTVEWRSNMIGFISNQDSMRYEVSVPDTISVRVGDGGNCSIQRNTVILISEPEVEVIEDGYQIMKGESVQLTASGGSRYLWSPAGGLNDPESQQPMASPIVTTEYTVTAYDSIGCSTEARTIVIVEETAFIPSLFTPNQDGKNDALKIYGLGSVNNFSFAVYNREGSLVYDTRNVTEITTHGWNGTARGTHQPAGVYHWKVTGEINGGKRLQLNGKLSGSVVLLR